MRTAQPMLARIWRLWRVALPSLAAFSLIAATQPDGTQAEQKPRAYRVSSLKDNGPGTLRHALQTTEHRRIVFDVGGQIELKEALRIERDGVTIDGRDAPSPGVTISGQPLVIRDARDVTLGDLRFRDSDDDNVRLIGACRDVLIDHCSLSDAGDGAIDITVDYTNPERFPKRITISNCFIAETDKAMLIVKAERVTLIKNFFLHNQQRNPQLHRVQDFRFMNNVVSHWGSYGVRIRAGSTGDVISNRFGSSSNPNKSEDAALVVTRRDGRAGGTSPAGEVFISGNIGPKGMDFSQLSSRDSPLLSGEAPALEASDVPDAVIPGAGARPRGPLDRQIRRRHAEAIKAVRKLPE